MNQKISEGRKYFAVSIKHSVGWKYGERLTLWGSEQTADADKRCFSGYTRCPVRAELYALGEFEKDGYWNGNVMKLDAPVHITKSMVKKLKFDTVLVEAEEYIQYCKENGIRVSPPTFKERMSYEPKDELVQMVLRGKKAIPIEYGYDGDSPIIPCWKYLCEKCCMK